MKHIYRKKNLKNSRFVMGFVKKQAKKE